MVSDRTTMKHHGKYDIIIKVSEHEYMYIKYYIFQKLVNLFLQTQL